MTQEVLKNGTRILLLPNEQTIDVGICFAIAAGFRFEGLGQKSFTHLLEHLMAVENLGHGTTGEFARALDRFTHSFDAETGETVMTLSALTSRANVLPALGLLTQAVLRPRFRQARVKHEQRLIRLEELLQQDDTELWVNNLAEDSMFLGNGFSRLTSSWQRLMTETTASQLRQWHRTVVRGQRLVVCVSGNFDQTAVRDFLKKRFATLPAGAEPCLEQPTKKQHRLRCTLVPRSRNLVHLSIIFPTFGFDDPNRIALSVLNNHLGADDRWSNRLYSQLVSQRGLTYKVFSSVWHYADIGHLTIYTATQPETVPDTLRVIGHELHRLYHDRLTDEELELAKQRLIAGSRDHPYTPLHQAGFYAQQLLAIGRVIPGPEYSGLVNAVQARDVKRVARLVFQRARTNIVLVGQTERLTSRDVRRALQW